jgi:hypothetical protein
MCIVLLSAENLTPWKKLLPCLASGSNDKGLAGLLDNAPKLHHSAYHSLRMDLREICAVSVFHSWSDSQSHVRSLSRSQNVECTSTQLELSMSLAIVVDAGTAKAGHAGESL